MAETKFLKLISKSKPILADGAMGTLLHEQGCNFNSCFDELNLTKPDLVAEIHKAYIDAGSQIILTNTFGASHYKLEKHGLISKIGEINSGGVSLARQVVSSSSKDVLIGGDIGPLGVRMAPFGRVQPEEARNAFKEQIVFLLDEKVDLLVAETFSDLYEMREAILAVRELSTDIPLVASMTFTRDDRTVLGDSPIKVARSLRDFGADVIGVNCSGGPNQLIRILKEMRAALPECKFWIKPNAGWPEQMGGRIFYPASADYFGDYALAFWKAGANVIGGCCGTTPAHIASMRDVLDRTPKVEFNDIDFSQERTEQETSEAIEPTRLAKKLSKGKFVFAVEMDPPRGLSTHKLLASASLIEEAGADVIDVADSPMARMRMSPWAVCNLIQSRVKIETVLHFPTRGRNLLRVQGDLLAAHALDVRNVFVVMGDPTAIGDYPTAMDNYDLAPSGLIKMIKQGFNAGVDHAGSDIGQPTNFFVGTALNLVAPDIHRELTLIRRKIENGADFVLTQPIYTIHPLEDFLNLYEKEYGQFPLPIMAGILPLVSARHAAFLQQEVPGISIPDHMHEHMQQAGEKGAKKGIELAVKLIGEMKELAQGVYLMPAFNRFDYAAEIIEKCK
jgi:methionine synthase I (cobalamin-dependent)/5,10-methylenetetrahydrofolate reductase